MKFAHALSLGLLIGGSPIASLRAQSQPDYELPPIEYSTRTPRDAFASLRSELESGAWTLPGDERQMLQALLDRLAVPTSSQVLVFSRTSLQRGRIRPERPRALYFSDSVYVGWVPGGLFEVAAIDPVLGPVFYSIDARPPGGGRPRVDRDPDCLRCHGGTFVRDIPGVFARSVFPDATGEPLLRHGTQLVDDATPFSERWGGWYVTGYKGREPHRGNVLASEAEGRLTFAPDPTRPDQLSGYFSTTPYLRPTSDIVALLVLEHQMTVQNCLTRAGLTTRRMIAYQHGLQKAFKEAVTDEPAYESVKSVMTNTVQDVVDHLLFRGAAPLPDGVVGHEEFRRALAADAPRSAEGHALKDLHLEGRLFRFRCSYLIYSAAFRGLPDTLKVRVLDRLRTELQSKDPNGRYAYIPEEERQQIFSLLRQTHADARECWKEPASIAGQTVARR
ncbi:MAG TPA: hypothetical protein PKX00_06810 [Opitutaceae bacterium]|jgi:hypothetical protein|nr:hypothetical protein [Opitutaceae bacterium]HRE05301.1 hypothetical protein [Opitutaceae bacterium]